MADVMDGETDTGCLGEIAVGGRGLGGILLKQFYDLGTSGLDRQEHIVVGYQTDGIAKGQLTGGNVRADAAAIDEGDIRREFMAEHIGNEVTGIGLLKTYICQSCRLVHHHEVVGGGTDDPFDDLIHEGLHAVCGGLDDSIVIGDLVGGYQGIDEAAVRGDEQLTHVDKLRSCLADADDPALLVGHIVAGNDGMAMTVEDGINTCCGGNETVGVKTHRLGLLTYVGE